MRRTQLAPSTHEEGASLANDRLQSDEDEPRKRQRATCGLPPTRLLYDGNARRGLLYVHASCATAHMSENRRRIPRSAALLGRESTCAPPDSSSLGILLWRLCLHDAVFVSAFAYQTIQSESIAQVLAHDKAPVSKNRELQPPCPTRNDAAPSTASSNEG